MATQLEQRLRRYGETFERAVAVDVRREPTALRPVPFYRHRLVVAIGAAASVILIAAGVAFFARAGDDESSPVSPPEPTPRIPSLGIDQVWPGPEIGSVDRSSPAATASAFIRDVLGQDAVGVSPDSAAAPADPNWVDASLANGTPIRVLTVPGPDGWMVLQVGDEAFGYGGPDGIYLDPVPAASSLIDLAWRDDAGLHRETFPTSDLVDGRAPVLVDGQLFSVVLVNRDDTGGVASMFGGHFGPVVVADPDARVMVLNAGVPGGSATNLSNQLRANGYAVLTPGDTIERVGTAVQCRPGFEAAGIELLIAVGGGAVVEPFTEPPADVRAEAADCFVYLGRVDPASFTTVVLNAGAVEGTEQVVANELRLLGYNLLVPETTWARVETVVQCKDGVEEAVRLANLVGRGAVATPYADPPANLEVQDADCIVYLGRTGEPVAPETPVVTSP